MPELALRSVPAYQDLGSRFVSGMALATGIEIRPAASAALLNRSVKSGRTNWDC